MKIRYMKAEDADRVKIYKRTSQYYQNNEQVLLVRSAGYIYHVPRCIYDKAY